MDPRNLSGCLHDFERYNNSDGAARAVVCFVATKLARFERALSKGDRCRNVRVIIVTNSGEALSIVVRKWESNKQDYLLDIASPDTGLVNIVEASEIAARWATIARSAGGKQCSHAESKIQLCSCYCKQEARHRIRI